MEGVRDIINYKATPAFSFPSKFPQTALRTQTTLCEVVR